MIKVNVILKNIIWKKYLNTPQLFIRKKIELLNKKNNFFEKKKFIFTIILSGTKEIKTLNKKFRKKNKSTDVLSFPFYEKKILHKKIGKKKEIYLGDIIINLGMVKYKKDKSKFKKEINKLWVHGLAHLLGHKHKNEKDYIVMSKVEKTYLKLVN